MSPSVFAQAMIEYLKSPSGQAMLLEVMFTEAVASATAAEAGGI